MWMWNIKCCKSLKVKKFAMSQSLFDLSWKLFLVACWQEFIHHFNTYICFPVVFFVTICYYFRVFLSTRLHSVPGYHNPDAYVGKDVYRGKLQQSYCCISHEQKHSTKTIKSQSTVYSTNCSKRRACYKSRHCNIVVYISYWTLQYWCAYF